MADEEVIEQPITEEIPVVTDVPEDEPTVTDEPEPAPAPEPAKEAAPGKKFKKVVQPTDDQGQPLGQPHVYYYNTPEELESLMEATVKNGSKRILELKRQSIQPVVIPEGAEPEEEVPVWKPRDLTEEEKFIVKTDPEKAFDIQFEAKYGMTPEAKRKADQKTAEDTSVLRAQAETQMFKDETPDYYPCAENQNAIVQYIQKHKLAWRSKNLAIAFRELSQDGLLRTAPEPVAQEIPAPRTEAAEPAPKTPPSFPSAIRNNQTRATAPVARKQGPSAAEQAMMSPDDLKKLYPELRDAR